MAGWNSKKIILIAVLTGAVIIVAIAWFIIRSLHSSTAAVNAVKQQECLRQAKQKSKVGLKQATKLSDRRSRRLDIRRARFIYAQDRAACRKQFPTVAK